MSTSAIGTIKDALVAALKLRANLAGVNIFSGFVGVEEAGVECIALEDARLVEVAAAMGGNRIETWEIDGEVAAVKPWTGGTTELTIKAARDRAVALLAEIETHLNDTYAGELPSAQLIGAELSDLIGAEGRVCVISFTLSMQQMKNP